MESKNGGNADAFRSLGRSTADEPSDIARLLDWQKKYPYTLFFPQPTELRDLASYLANQLFKDWVFINNVVVRHEETIRKKRLAKSTRERRRLLLRAYPSMPAQRRPDIEMTKSVASDLKENPLQQPAHYDSSICSMPHINQEDLIQAKPLLIFLNSRARHHPGRFALSELLYCPLALYPENQLWKQMGQFMVSFFESDQPDTYGRMQRWPHMNEAMKLVLSGHEVHPGTGVHILRIQKETCSFLRRVCMEILRDISEVAMIGTTFPIQPEPPHLDAGGPGMMEIMDIITERPYRLHSNLEFSRLRSLITAHIEDLEDRVWALREDPSYFAETFNDHIDHWPALVDLMNEPPSVLKEQLRRDRIGRGIRDITINSYFLLFNWQGCQQQLCHLERLRDKYEALISPKKDLPEVYSRALEVFWKLIHSILNDCHQNIRIGLRASPQLRKYFIFKNDPAGSKRYYTEPRLKKIAENETVARLVNIVGPIIQAESPGIDGFSRQLDEFEIHLGRNPAAKDLISPYVAHMMSQMSVASTCIQQLYLYTPWSTKIMNDIAGPELYPGQCMRLDLDLRYCGFTEKWNKILVLEEFEDELLHKLADPSDGKFSIPSNHPQNGQSIAAIQKAEENLDKLWESLDAFCKKTVGNTLPNLFNEDITRGRVIRRTPSWSVMQASKKALEASSLAAHRGYQSLSVLDHDASSHITGAFDKFSVSERTKLKTRGTPRHLKTTQNDANANQAYVDSSATLNVAPASAPAKSSGHFFTPILLLIRRRKCYG